MQLKYDREVEADKDTILKALEEESIKFIPHG
jgi:hypothetical protein